MIGNGFNLLEHQPRLPADRRGRDHHPRGRVRLVVATERRMTTTSCGARSSTLRWRRSRTAIALAAGAPSSLDGRQRRPDARRDGRDPRRRAARESRSSAACSSRLKASISRPSCSRVPVANSVRLRSADRHTPIDAANLNRLVPRRRGRHVELSSSRMSSASELLAGCDRLIDVHSGGNLATVDYVYIGTDGEMAKAFGCDLALPRRGSRRLARRVRRLARRAGADRELGGGQQRNEHFVAQGSPRRAQRDEASGHAGRRARAAARAGRRSTSWRT